MAQYLVFWKIVTSIGFALSAGAWATYLFEPVNPVTRSLLFLIPAALFAVGLIYDLARKETTTALPPVVAQLVNVQRRSYQEMIRQLSSEQRSELGRLFAGERNDGQFIVMRRSKAAKIGAIARFALLNLALGAALLLLHAALAWVALPNAAQIDQIAQHVQLHLSKEASGKIAYKGVANELYAPLDNISQAMREAVIMREDPAFRTHWGFNPRRKLISVGMSAVHLATFGIVGRKQGGSTITEQLAKNLFLSGDSGFFSGIRRKFKEQILAFKLEASYSKDEILEMYLNLIHLGRGAQGVEAAARLYFNKQSDELAQIDEYEAAILAQSLTAPNQNNCVRNREDTDNTVALLKAFGNSGERVSYPAIEKYLEAQKRGDAKNARKYSVANAKLRNLDAERRLDAMQIAEIVSEIRVRERTAVQVRSLFEKIGEPAQEARLAQTIERCVQNGQRDLIVPEPGYFLDWILPEIRQSDYFDDLNGDFTVVTTMDARMQRFAQDAMKTTFRNSVNNGLFSQANMPQAALIAMTPNGAIQAMMGGREEPGGFNRAVLAQRQPGSTFKLFVYLTALEQGWTPEKTISDQPDAKGWPGNGSHGYSPTPVSLTNAFEESRNAAAVNLLQKIGVEPVKATAARLGVTGDFSDDIGLALALGVRETRPLEMAAAYAALANGGFQVMPYGILGVRTKGGTIRYWHEPPRPRRLIEEKTVTQMNAMLRAVVTDGTGRQAQFDQQFVGGKTGTTQGGADAWFIGCTAHLCAGIWMGYDTPRPMPVSGSTLPAQMFRQFMQKTHDALQWPPTSLP